MNTSNKIYNTLKDKPFSYGEALSVILENQGRSISNLPEEDFVFPDNSYIRLTHQEIKLVSLLQE